MIRYSQEMKEQLVAKMLSPNGPSALKLSAETGIAQPTLSKWKRSFGAERLMTKSTKKSWTPEQKLQAVFQYQSLSEAEQGVFLRKSGLLSSNIDEWKSEALEVMAGQRKVGRPKKDPELVAAEAEIKTLKSNLRRKDAALAEQTALVILQKKAQEIWGNHEDEK